MSRLNDAFQEQMVIHWNILSRTTNLLILLNISLFFLTELVTTQGYFYTYYSLYLLLVVKIGLLIPLGLLNRLWYYCIFLVCEAAAIYFLVSSVWFWVVTNKL